MPLSHLRPKIVVLFFAKALGLFALARQLTSRRLRILCYHGGCIGDELGYNPKLFCSTDTFRQRIAWLQRKGFNFVSLDDAVRTPNASRGRLDTVITFDDGWYSTGRELLPVLAERGIPSTLYLCTQHFLEGWPVLNVATRYLLWKAPRQVVTVRGIGPDVDGEHDLAQPAVREALARAVVAALGPSAQDRQAVCDALERLGACIGVDRAALALDSRRFDYMTADEVRAAASTGCAIELHGHAHYYPRGAPEQFRTDLALCEAAIVALGLPRPRHYCYPSGSFDDAAAGVLSDLGIVSATTCVPGLIANTAPPHAAYLPRFLDGESIHRLEFEAEMSGFTDFLRRAMRAPVSQPGAKTPAESGPMPVAGAAPK